MEIAKIKIEEVPFEMIVDLRYEVLRAGLPRAAANFPGDQDAKTVHVAAHDGEAVVGCASVMVNEWEGRPACQLRGMAVDPKYQGAGVGGRLLAAIEAAARRHGVDLIWANCRSPAVPFYRKNGWEIVSKEFEIPTAGPHFRMIRPLK
ncbi:MAG TPA: GNAT family N-acetyltransferase [Tepidisphaeraceae bacterium]